MFMSREQIIYLLFMFFDFVIYGMLSPTFVQLDIGLGSRYYAVQLMICCVSGVLYAYVATDVEKKRWIFKHYKIIDFTETLIFSIVDITFLIVYFLGQYNPIIDWQRVCRLFFVYNFLLKIVRTLITTVLPSIGNVFEQSLYKNQIDYQNHSNAEILMDNFGAMLGALLAFVVGDYFKERPYYIFLLIILDWASMWSRWQFYFKPENYSIIKRNFAKDSGQWKRQQKRVQA